ncbi:MAG: hypothetical protein Q9M17_09100 [Mariprofundus sp.]|nr:hypothetical protein [Mariprofundus sp.]
MKLSTSKILAQLSEQDRKKVELELSELHAHKQRLIQQQNGILSRIRQLNVQRDQVMKKRNTASLLQDFNLSIQEQHSMLTLIYSGLHDIEAQQQDLLKKFNIAFRKHHNCEKTHQKNQRQQRQKAEQKQQRQLDDLFAARLPTAAR